MEYLKWNDLIAEYFFNEENAGKEVLLYVNDEILKEIGQKNGCGVDDFINNVKKGPPWAHHSGLCQKALQTYKGWRGKNLKYPPYISYLACFVLAAGIHGDFAPHAYYPPLRKILGENDTSPLPSFDKMIELWDDLEKWSIEDKHEELGRFVARIRGGWWKVGLPLSQRIISKNELKRLPALFDKAGLDPSAPPSPQVMLKLMRYHGDMVFEKKTLKVLGIEKGEHVVLKNKLVEMVLNELEQWDGTVHSVEAKPGYNKGEEDKHRINGALRICITLDQISGEVRTYLRLKNSMLYPENGLIFKCRKFPGTLFYCEEAYRGWSKKIKNEEAKVLSASSIDWVNGALFRGQDNKWRAILKGNKVRLFVSAKNEGFSEWIETNRLNKGTRFLVAASEGYEGKIRSWGNSNCNSFEELKVKGLPRGWLLFKGFNASASCDNIDVLSIPPSARLLLKGGVKIRGGNTYLHTAPPLIVLENVSGTASMTVNEKPLKPARDESRCWKLPCDVNSYEILRIEAKAGQDELRKTLRLENPHLPDFLEQAPWRNIRGQLASNGSKRTKIRGAVVLPSGADSRTPTFLKKNKHSHRIVYIGNAPGRVSEWPKDPFPQEWKPVWAIEKEGRKKWRVSCCKNSFRSIPPAEKTVHDERRKKVKKWKEYVWFRRKKVKKPQIPVVKKKWIEYSEAAKNV